MWEKGMGLRAPFVMVLAGIFAMTVGVTSSIGPRIELTLAVMGFIMMVTGTILAVKSAFTHEPKTRKTERDNPALIRIVGAVIALASLTMPYVRTPLVPSMEGASHSLVGLLTAVQSGAHVQVGFLMLLLMGVVVTGAFISLLHHAGGYIMLFGSMTIAFIAMQTLGSIQGFQQQLELGIYLAVLAALIIISSAFSKPDTGIDPESDWY